MSNVVVIFGQRRATIRTQPTKQLSEIRTDACFKFGLSPASNYILKRNGAKLDLSLPLRFTSIAAGAKLDMIQVSSTAASVPVSVVLRTVDPVEQLSGFFAPSTSVFTVLRRFEQDARLAGRENVNLTERGKPSEIIGSRRLLYQMPAVRVTNRELASFEDLKRTLVDLGCGTRELLVLRFVPTDIPFEEALKRIGKIEDVLDVPGEVDTSSAGDTLILTDKLMEVSQYNSNDIMVNPPERIIQSGAQAFIPEIQPGRQPGGISNGGQSTITVFKPSSSDTPAAANFEVPDSAYEINVNQLNKIKENYAKEAMPKRLLSDKEIEEKEAIVKQEMEKIDHLRIRVSFPDGFISMQELPGQCTANELYALVRSNLRYPNEAFILLIPPRETIAESSKRLTIDLKIRSGASLHLAWAKEASQMARNNPVLKDTLVKGSKELPRPIEPMDVDADENNKQVDTSKEKRKVAGKKEGVEKFREFLRLGKR